MERYDAVIVGSGPNGLAAAVELARHGRRVAVLEAASKIGGGTRTEELTMPGVRHDVCSAVHPLGAGSPYLRTLPLADYGLTWLQPDVALAHPLDDRTAVVLDRSLDATAADLGADGDVYRKIMAPLVENLDDLFDDILGPLIRVPRHPMLLARFGANASLPLTTFARRFETPGARALLAGLAAHSIAPLNRPFTTAIALVLAAAGHRFGWPVAQGGSQAIADALAGYLEDLGGTIFTDRPVTNLGDIPDADAVLFNLMPGAIADIAGDQLSQVTTRFLRGWRHGPASYKVDWVLDGPVPWIAAACRRAGTVHVGGTVEEIVASEARLGDGPLHPNPFVLIAQPSVVDPTRAPDGRHVVWGYTHMPRGDTSAAGDRIEAQIERFAPGFRDLIVARHSMGPADLERHNANYVGGDIGGGAFNLRNVVLRPRPALDPYHLGEGFFIASSASPPGAGVHGMAGLHAARSVLRRSG